MDISIVPKTHHIHKVSNPSLVRKNADKYLGSDFPVYVSSRKDKKYMIASPRTGRVIHFGDINYEDYTYHNSDARRLFFRSRNYKWRDADKYSPAWLSYWLLW